MEKSKISEVSRRKITQKIVFKAKYSIARIFFFIFCVLAVPFVCFVLSQNQPPLSSWMRILIAALLVCLVPSFIDDFRRWKIYRLPSGVMYLYWAIFLMPLELCVFLELNGFSLTAIEFNASVCFLIVGLLLDLCVPSHKVTAPEDFSSESVGLDRDKYEMLISAKNNANFLKKTQKHVSVISLNADTGYGKSSFVRMMIESLPPKNFLYTYVSLTETNDSKDFSRLFAERWAQTLDDRYPTLSNSFSLHLDLLSALLREEKGCVSLSAFIKQIKILNFPLFPIKQKAHDPFVIPKLQVPGRVGQLFGGIPKIKEESWVVVIDDFERSPIDEIYRVIEVVERFKFEGRNGMPVPVVFLFCFAGINLKELLNKEEKNKRGDLAFLVEQFLFTDATKSIDRFINPPPIAPDLLREHIINKIEKL